jgi:hypothetical protein
VVQEYCVLLTPDCDLLSDYERMQKGEPFLNGVLLYEADTIAQRRPSFPDNKSWRFARDNRDDRYHFLEAVSTEQDLHGQGLPELMIDFRRMFTISAKEIFRQVGMEDGAKRRCRLEMPYREHLQSRAANYTQRVMLPRPHMTTWGESTAGPAPAGRR